MPSSDPISHDVRRFVLSHIPSVPYLEAALLFHREPAMSRSVGEVAQALYVQDSAAAGLLASLLKNGILAQSGDRFSYAPRDASLALAMDALAKAYFSDLIGVTRLIHDATQKSATRFADAFKLRKDP